MSELIQFGDKLYKRIDPAAIAPPQLPPPAQSQQQAKKPSKSKALKDLQDKATRYLAIFGLIVLALAFFKFSDFGNDKLIPSTYISKMAETLSADGLQTKYCNAADLEQTIRALTQLKQPTTLKIIQLQAADGSTISGYLIGYRGTKTK